MNNRIKNVVIIGAGQLGSRHLQGLSKIDRSINAYVVDPSTESLETAKIRYDEAVQNIQTNIESVTFSTDIYNLPEVLDVVIVATSSNVRKVVVESVLNEKVVQYLVLEKFLFQTVEDFKKIDELLEEKNVKAWVNCPRRIWDFYQDLKIKLQNVNHIDYSVSGSNIGIGSNTIHFLDHLAYLVNDSNMTLSSEFLDDQIIQSKRNGFIEFLGTIHGVSSKGHQFSLTSFKEDGIPLTIQINSDKLRCVIRESEGKALISTEDENWSWKEVPFRVMYQSELTHLVVQNILDNGECLLPTYHESSKLHLTFLASLFTHMEKVEKKEITFCPIT